MEGEIGNLSLRVVGIARLSFASLHAKQLLKLHTRHNNIVTFRSHIYIILACSS